MNGRIIIFPWKMTSKSAQRLAEELQDRGYNCLRVYSDRDYHPKRGDFVIFYGSGWKPNWWNEMAGIPMMNHPDAIHAAVNKITTFNMLDRAGVRTVPHTTNPRLVIDWLESSNKVFARTLVKGKDGEGIVVIDPQTCEMTEGMFEFDSAPLYTKFIEAQMEYRVHVFEGTYSICQEKRPPEGEEVKHSFIRTGSNNWAFCRPRQNIPRDVFVESINAVRAMGLDFGGVDVLWDGEHAWVLEVNSAPEIVGTDVDVYANLIEHRFVAMGGNKNG